MSLSSVAERFHRTNTINHGIPLDCLSWLGLEDIVLGWICSHGTDREYDERSMLSAMTEPCWDHKNYVLLKGIGTYLHVTVGRPARIWINHQQYINDVQLYFTMSFDPKETVNMNMVISWISTKKLKLNSERQN